MNVRGITVVVLALALVASALVKVWIVHVSRENFIALQRAQSERDAMNVDWGRLQIEQAAWSTHARIEQVAAERLGMRLPDPSRVIVVRP